MHSPLVHMVWQEKRDDKKLRFYSMNFEQLGVIESSVEGLKPEKEADWTNYPKGVMWAFGEKGMKVEQGMDLVLFGNIPNGSGLLLLHQLKF